MEYLPKGGTKPRRIPFDKVLQTKDGEYHGWVDVFCDGEKGVDVHRLDANQGWEFRQKFQDYQQAVHNWSL